MKKEGLNLKDSTKNEIPSEKESARQGTSKGMKQSSRSGFEKGGGENFQEVGSESGPKERLIKAPNLSSGPPLIRGRRKRGTTNLKEDRSARGHRRKRTERDVDRSR